MLPISIPFATRFANLVSSPRKELLVGESFPLYLPSLLCTQGSERRKEEEKEEGAAFQLPSFPPHSNCLPPPPLLCRPLPPPFLPPPRTPLMEFLHPPPQKERENGKLWSLRFSSRLFIRQISSSVLLGGRVECGRPDISCPYLSLSYISCIVRSYSQTLVADNGIVKMARDTQEGKGPE